MKKEMRRDAARMLARAQKLGLTGKDGSPLVIDQMEELLAARDGFRNAHAYRAALEGQETPVLKLENPQESGSDYRLEEGRGCWITMGGVFSVHPYLTDEGVVIDVYAKGAEMDESLTSCYAFTADAEDALEQTKNDQAAAGISPEGIERLKRAALEDLGYEIKPDVDQPNLWVWTAPTDSCEASFSNESEALADAWHDAASQAKSIARMTDSDWDSLAFDKQRERILSLGES